MLICAYHLHTKSYFTPLPELVNNTLSLPLAIWRHSANMSYIINRVIISQRKKNDYE